MAEKHVAEVIIKGTNQLTGAAAAAAADLTGIAKAARMLSSIELVRLAKQGVKATAELVVMGSKSLATRDRLVAFAGGAAQADKMVAALAKSSDNTIDRMTAMALASQMIETGLASTTDEMEIAGAMVGKLGNQTWTTERRMNSLTMLLANQSKRRLDDFGLDVAKVTNRQKELEAQGLSTQDAFKSAVFEQAGAKLQILGDQTDKAATKVNRFTANWSTMTQVIGESLATIVTDGGALDRVGGWMEAIAQRTIAVNEGLAKAKELGVAPRIYAEAYKRAGEAARVFQGDEEELRKAIESKNAALREGERDLKSIAKAEWDTVQASRAMRDTFAGFAADRAQSKADEAAAVTDANEQMAQATLDYQATAAGVYTSLAQLETGHAARMQAIAGRGARGGAGGGRASQMGAINEAQQRELSRLQDILDTRDWHKTLEDMARDHEARIAGITVSSAEDQANERYKALVDGLNAEQRARMDALKRQYGQAVSGDDVRSDLEEEHRRRMMGLYTKSARDAETARYEEAKSRLEFEDAAAALEETFENEREIAKATHEAAITSIAVQAEIARYNTAVAGAQAQRAQQHADEAARLQITRQYDQMRAQEQSAAEAHRRGIAAAAQQAALQAEVASYERRKAALHQQLSHAQSVRDQVSHAMREMLDAIRGTAQRTSEIADQIARRNAQGTEQGAPRYQHGTNNHPGGLAWVGEKEPELLELPRGSRVTPLSSMRRGSTGGEVTIHNHFGTGSVRSDRDIRAVAEAQETSLRLRGAGVLQ